MEEAKEEKALTLLLGKAEAEPSSVVILKSSLRLEEAAEADPTELDMANMELTALMEETSFIPYIIHQAAPDRQALLKMQPTTMEWVKSKPSAQNCPAEVAAEAVAVLTVGQAEVAVKSPTH